MTRHPPNRATPRVVTIGPATLICGDAMAALEQMRSCDAVLFDPPYGMNYKSGFATDALWSGGQEIAGDKTTALRDALIAHFSPRPTLCFGTWKIARPAPTKMVLIWDKLGALGMGDLSLPWKPDHEEIYVIGSGFIGSRDSGSVIDCPPVQSMAKNGRLHPTEKPVNLLVKLSRKLPGAICDPTMGSGSTAIAALKLGRRFVGCEISEEYFAIAVKRVSEFLRQPNLFDAGAV